jgi:filamentous hemagglutinin family protein
MNIKISQLYSFPLAIFTIGLSSLPSYSQIVPDNSLNSQVTTQENIIQIDGGFQSENGVNLFHSFQELSIPADITAYFNNNSAIKNIFTRVTGDSVSNINGTIKANSSANLFLINPNGIIFGKNASLDIGGSFLATTAERIFFDNGAEFRTNNINDRPLLTISTPIGLGFGENTGSITNLALLKVSNSATLALVGGELTIGKFTEQGVYSSSLVAEDGSIELGSVGNNNIVDLEQKDRGLELVYSNINNWQNIIINSTLFFDLDKKGNPISFASAIQIQAKEIILNNSFIASSSQNIEKRNTLIIQGSEQIELLGGSQLSVGSNLAKNGSSFLNIYTKDLSLENSNIYVQTLSKNNAGNADIYASESVKLSNSALLLSSEQSASGNAGNLNLVTKNLTIQDGAQITSSTIGKGNGGVLNINAANQIMLSVTSPQTSESTSVISVSAITGATGNVGKIIVNTGELIVEKGAIITANNSGLGSGGEIILNVDNLIVRDGSFIRAGTFFDGSGGNLVINAENSIEVSGSGTIVGMPMISNISTQSGDRDFVKKEGKGIAGNLTIFTPQLVVKDGAEINVSAIGEGKAGNLLIDSNNIFLEDKSKFTAATEFGDRGNIEIDTKTLTLRDNSNITTNATESATGGNITINSNVINVLENSNITANAIEGKGGNIILNTQGLFQSLDSIIDASSKFGLNGTITINTPDIDPTQGLLIVTPQIVDASSQISQVCNKNLNDEKASSFIVTGRGGIPNTPLEPLTETTIFADWIFLPNEQIIEKNPEETPQLSNNLKMSPQIIEAQGWVVDAKGKITLVTKDDRPHNYTQNVANDCDRPE